MRILLPLAVLVAVAVGIWAIVLALRAPDATVELPTTIDRPGSRPATRSLVTEPSPRGGIYRGVVVRQDGSPIPGAQVALVAVAAGDAEPRGGGTDGAFDPTLLPRPGEGSIAAEGTTDAAGGFDLAADAGSRVGYVAAHHPGFMIRMVEVGGPSNDIRIVLSEAGRVEGTVVDAETGRPVPGADVAIFLQNRTAGGLREGESRTPTETVGVSAEATMQRFLAKVFGERVWNVPWRGDEALHVITDRDGEFTFGPIADTVQLEFVITHAEYAWTEQGEMKDGVLSRLVVEPGQTVRKTFSLQKGKFIEGRVLDESNNGVEGVLVEVEHVVQYHQHWWYRQRPRRAITRKDGHFRVAGLSHGPYFVTLRHASFGTQFIPQVPENETGLEFFVRSVGGMQGTVVGIDGSPAALRVEVLLERTEDDPMVGRHTRRSVRLDPDARFLIEDLAPGDYMVWVQAESLASVPQPVAIRSLEVSRVEFELGGGADLVVHVRDSSGRAVDPAAATLIQVREEGDRAIGHFVSRAGQLSAPGLSPGRYRLRITAPGFVETATDEPFTLEAGKVTDLGTIRLARWSNLDILAPRTASGQPLGEVEIWYQHGDEKLQRVFNPVQAVPVRPGKVTVRSTSSAGLSFEKTFEVPEGATVPVQIVLR